MNDSTPASTCERCASSLENDSVICERCGFLPTSIGHLLSNLPALGVTALLAATFLGMQPGIRSLLPTASGGADLSDVTLSAVKGIGNFVIVTLGVYLFAFLVGMTAGCYVVPRKWWARCAVAAIGWLFAFGAVQLGCALNWLSPQTPDLIAVGCCALGAAIGTPMVTSRANGRWFARLLPEWLGAAKALIFVPLATAIIGFGIYVLAGVMLAALALLFLVGALRAVFTKDRGGLRWHIAREEKMSQERERKALDLQQGFWGASGTTGIAGQPPSMAGVETRDAEGNIIGITRPREESILGGTRLETRAPNGDLIAVTEAREGDMISEARMETKAPDGTIISVSRPREG